ncbi:MAG: hypothetical protein J5J00_15815 [Deltaproteobacteria bacterium]|nr:hypothetical protein [Deltaproteobacteria bacterium]
MGSTFEDDFPMPAIVAGFVALIILSQLLRRWLRKRHLIREGQLTVHGAKPGSVEERVSANRRWASGEIRSTGRGFMLALWLLAAVWNLTFGVSFIKAISNPDAASGQRVVLGVFAAAGLIPIILAVRANMRRFRFGDSFCLISGRAGVLGEKMNGTIRTSAQVDAIGDFIMTLQCVENYEVGSGKNRRTETRVHWQGKCAVPHSGQSSRAGIPFSFDLPTSPPETGYRIARGSINWQLRVDAPVQGVDYSAMFIVPVFRVEPSSK